MNEANIKIKVALIEDEEVLLNVLKDKLEKEGFEVYPAADGGGRLARIKHKFTQGLIFDIRIPQH